jgi:DEAD/DEAH box helicase domain-containing protein
MASDPTSTLPARRTPESRQVALHSALSVLASGSALDRADTPDEVVTAVRRLPAVEAAYAPFPDAIDPRLKAAFEARGVHQLYTHQAEAFDHVANGRQVVVTTPTASGKTLCYNLPVLDRILKNPAARALYLFPTKALAQDQMAELHELAGAIGEVGGEPIGVHTYDGDTPQDARRTIRTRAHVVLSNPDMVHSGILPHHPRWAKLFENLHFVIIDELHAYRGVFGSHLTNVLRRLQRICRHYGSNPQFICSSATIANPSELAERLVEKPFSLVEKSGAPRGEKFFVLVNPPVVNRELGIRRSYVAESRRVAGEFLRRHLQVIVFAQSRTTTEILTTYLKEDFEDVPGMPERIRGYRGGYLPLRRREIEKGLRAGQVRGVVSTNALELGIDIGALDVCVMAGYPGTIASTWQRAGRAGRRTGQSAAVMVASSAPIDQFMARHPSFFFDASPEHALVNPDNLHILVDHVKCAAFELPFTTEETYGQVNVQEVLGVLQESGLVHRSGSEDAEGQWHWTSESYPANAVSLRSVSSDNFVITDHTSGPKVIGETDFTSALSTLHPKAIYMVEGRIYQVEELDFVGRKAHVREVDCDYYTTAITYTKVTILDRFAADEANLALHGEVHVVSRVVGFKKIRFQTNENVGSGDLDLPEQQMHTTSYWLEIPLPIINALPYAADDRRDGVIGLAFAMKQIAQLLLMCDARDIGLSVNTGDRDQPFGPEAESWSRRSGEAAKADTPRIFIYDAYPGGIGFSAPLWGMQRELLSQTSALITSCDCDTGCPMCVGPIGETGPLAKKVALRILEHLLAPFDEATAKAVALQTNEEVPF